MVTNPAPKSPRPRSERAADALESIVYGSVAITARSIASTGFELTFLQWRAIVIVGETSHGSSMSEVARRLGAELSPTSRLVQRLVRRGLVSTAKSDADRRVTRVKLTPMGRGLRDGVLRDRRALLDEILAAADPLDSEQGALIRIGDAFGPYR